VPEVVKAVPLRASGRERQLRILAVERLDRRLLIDAEHSCLRRRMLLQSDNVGRLLLEVRIVGRHVAIEALRLQAVLRPHPRQTRRVRTFEEKQRIVEEASRPGASVTAAAAAAAVAHQRGLNANLVFGWCRLHRRGLLEGQRHAPPLLPVQITSPTLTPTPTPD